MLHLYLWGYISTVVNKKKKSNYLFLSLVEMAKKWLSLNNVLNSNSNIVNEKNRYQKSFSLFN